MNRQRELIVGLSVSVAALVFQPNASYAYGELLPFWGQPYPYRYAYDEHHDSCYKWERVETAKGPRRAYVWDCGNVVRSRY